MTLGGGTPDDIQAQRDRIPDVKRKETTVLTDSLRAELKELINEVLDEREQLCNTTVTFPSDYETFNHDISINTEGTVSVNLT